MSQNLYRDQLASSIEASIDEWQSAIDTVLNSTDHLFRHHLAQLRTLFSAQAQADLSRPPSDFTQPVLEHSIAYFRGLNDIRSEALAAFTALGEQQQERLHRTFGEQLDRYAKANAHHEAAVTAVRSAVSAANSVFANANRAARQVVELTDASVNASASATSRAASGALTPARKKAA